MEMWGDSGGAGGGGSLSRGLFASLVICIFVQCKCKGEEFPGLFRIIPHFHEARHLMMSQPGALRILISGLIVITQGQRFPFSVTSYGTFEKKKQRVKKMNKSHGC